MKRGGVVVARCGGEGGVASVWRRLAGGGSVSSANPLAIVAARFRPRSYVVNCPIWPPGKRGRGRRWKQRGEKRGGGRRDTGMTGGRGRKEGGGKSISDGNSVVGKG